MKVKNAAAKQEELEQQLVTVEESLKIKTDAVSAFAAEKKAAVQAVSICTEPCFLSHCNWRTGVARESNERP